MTDIYSVPTIDISKLSRNSEIIRPVSISLWNKMCKGVQQRIRSRTDSYSFAILQAYLKSPEKNLTNGGPLISIGRMLILMEKIWSLPTKSQNINVFTDLTKNKNEQVTVNATYRSLQVVNPRVSTQQADKSLLSRVEYSVHEWKRLVAANALYELGSGSGTKDNYTYVAVPAGTGQYTWIDLNHDGIQQLNEFVMAQFAGPGTYIRIYTPTNVFVKANYNTFNYSVMLNPRMLLGTKGGRI